MIINPQTDIGKRLVAYLRENPITINKLGPKVGITSMTLKKIIEGQVRIRTDIVFRLEKFLDNHELCKNLEVIIKRSRNDEANKLLEIDHEIGQKIFGRNLDV